MKKWTTLPALVGSLLLVCVPAAAAKTDSVSSKPPARGTTTTTVMGGGSPSTWPAAKPQPPSLAGAYSPNMKTAFLALVKYSDWLGSHPNPSLVKNYAAPSSNVYKAQVYLMQQMQKRGLHLPPTPSQIDFLVTTKKPTRRRSREGKPLSVAGRPAYTSGSVDVVIDEVTEGYLNRHNEVVGYTAKGTGPKPWSIVLVQNAKNGRYVIGAFYSVILHGSLQQWERENSRAK